MIPMVPQSFAPRATAATTGSNGLRPTGVAEAAFEVGEGAEVATLSLFVTETLPRRAEERAQTWVGWREMECERGEEIWLGRERD